MFYLSKNKIKFSKKIKINSPTIENKVNLSLIIYAYLNNENIDGFNKKDFKKWFKDNKNEILNFYYENNKNFYHRFFKNDNLKNKIENLFNYNWTEIQKIIFKNLYENDNPYNEFVKINNNLYSLINYLRTTMINNFNEFFKYINLILFLNKCEENDIK